MHREHLHEEKEEQDRGVGMTKQVNNLIFDPESCSVAVDDDKRMVFTYEVVDKKSLNLIYEQERQELRQENELLRNTVHSMLDLYCSEESSD